MTGLNEGTTYAFQLRAASALGNSPESDQATATVPTTVWTATLTVRVQSTYYGCDNGELDEMHDCSSATALTDNSFDYAGATYTVSRFYSEGATLQLNLAGVDGPSTKTALGALTLWVDGHKLTVSSAGTTTTDITWTYRPNWSNGQKVSLVLTE